MKAAIPLLAFVAGAVLADLTHPYGSQVEARTAPCMTDSCMAARCNVEGGEACHDPFINLPPVKAPEPEPKRLPLSCWPEKRYIRCEVL